MKMRKALAFSLMAMGLASVAGTASAAFLTPTVDGASIAAGSNGPSLAVQTATGGFGADLQLGELFVANDGTNLYVSIAGDNANGGSGIYLFIDSVSGGAANLATDPTGGYGEFNALGVAGGAVMPTGFGADFVLNLKAPGDGGSIGTWELAGNTASYRGNEGSYTGGFNAAQNNTNATAVPWAAGAVSTGAEIQIPLSAIGSPAAGTTIKLFAVAGNTSGGGANNVVYLSNQALPNSGTPGNFGRDGAGGDGVGTNFNGTGGPNITPANYTIAAAPFAGFTGSGTYTVGPGGNYATLAAFVEDVTGIIHGEGGLTLTAASTAATGTGTAFLSEVVPGDRLQVGTQIVTVASVESDTALTLTAGASAAAAAATYTINRATLPTITGNVTALITGDITEPKNISIMGDFSTHTLTIKPAPSTTPRITFTRPADNSGISGHLMIGGGLTNGNVFSNLTDRVVIDGSNTTGGTTRDLTIYTEQNYAFVCPVNVNGDNDNIEIKNVKIINNSPSTGASVSGIRFNTANIVTANTLPAPYVQGPAASFHDPDNYIVSNSEVTVNGSAGQQHAIRNSVSGAPTGASAQTGFQILNNDITATIRGVFMDGGAGGTISGNRIYIPGRAGFDTFGIFVNNARTPAAGVNATFSGNTMVVFNSSSAAQTNGASGVRIASAGSTTNTYTVENNTVYVQNTGTYNAGVEPVLRGIEVTSGVTSVVRHNTIRLIGSGMAGDAAAANMLGIGGYAANGNHTLRNNTVSSSVPFLALIRNPQTLPGNAFVSNNNNLFASGSALTATYIATNYATLANWQAAPAAQDAASVAVDPSAFTGGTSLHLISDPGAGFQTSNVLGGSVANDIDGQARGLTNVYYGADEFTANTLPTAISQSSVASIAENATGIIISNAKGTDADSLDFPVITAAASNGAAVSVTQTGVDNYRVNLTAGLDFETVPSFNVTLTATDRAGAQVVGSPIAINVTNVNEAPTAVALTNNTIAEGATAVGTLSTTDPDAANTFTYTLGGADAAAFTITGDALALNAAADFETKSSYAITVTSTDQGALATVAVPFTITVTDVNEAPTDITLSNATVNESLTSQTVGALAATGDPDAGATATFSLVSGIGDTDNALFSISGSNLVTAGTVTAGSYSVRVRATDNGTPTAATFEKPFAITVNDVADLDGDGVNDAVEGADANNPAAASFQSINAQALRLTTSAGSLAAVATAATPGSEPANTTFPNGTVSFNVTGLTNGQAVTITLTFPSNVAVYRAYKINGTTYTEIPGATIGATSISYSITDGGALDADGLANGTIVDPVAPAVFSTSVNDWMSLND